MVQLGYTRLATAEGGLQAVGRKGIDGAGNGTVGDHLLSNCTRAMIPVIERAIETAALIWEVTDPEVTAWKMISADFVSRSQPAQGTSGDVAFLHDEILQAHARRAEAGIPGELE